VKILICSENATLREELRHALEAAGHEVVCGAGPSALGAAASRAGALLVEPAGAKRAIAHLRDRGFAGRALLAGSEPQAELLKRVTELGADGVLPFPPAGDLSRRFALAVGGPRRVLVVDGDEETALLMKGELEKCGYAVLCALDVGTATHLILKRATRPDLVLLDVNLPRVSGAKFCRFLKANERFSGLKVVLCSDESRALLEKLALECGADAVIAKRELLGDAKAAPASRG